MIQIKKEPHWDTYDVLPSQQKDHRRHIVSKQVEKQLKNDWMYLDNGKYNRDNWVHVFHRMRKSKAKRLILQKNDHPSLIKQLSNTNFTSLTVLNLKSNKINNIEALCFINLPNLEWLYLGTLSRLIYEDNNDIVSLKPLVKTKFGHLKKLHFSTFLSSTQKDENRIKLIQPSRFYFGRCFMSFEAEISPMNRISQQDLSFLVKMNCLTMKSITFCAKNRIKQSPVYNSIQNRFNEIHFQNHNIQ